MFKEMSTGMQIYDHWSPGPRMIDLIRIRRKRGKGT